MTDGRLTILVVDDEAAQREILSEILSEAGHEVRTASDGEAALAALEAGPADLLITDLRMPNMDGITLLGRAKERRPELTVILMTAYATVASAVDAMKRGAHDYLQKPFSKAELLQRVARVEERVRLLDENARLRAERRAREAPEILGESDAIRKLRQVIARIAKVPGDVLVTGESGTGKELVARHIHYSSDRSSKPFVAVNCAAIPETLAESELFGHEKGAFTNATTSRAGRFEQADGGTLFLDEVSSMPAALQPKLLRVLQERSLERVGGSRTKRVDIRVISATNQDLRLLVRNGTFREDLYHRLNALEVHVPPLRDRGGDLRLLLDVFLRLAAGRFSVPVPDVSETLSARLDAYDFPGNVRELQHIVDKMVALSDGEPLDVGDLPPSIDVTGETVRVSTLDDDAGSAAPESLLAEGPVSLTDIERRLLTEAIRRAGGNLSEAAKQLGISYKTMQYRVRKFGLER